MIELPQFLEGPERHRANWAVTRKCWLLLFLPQLYVPLSLLLQPFAPQEIDQTFACPFLLQCFGPKVLVRSPIREYSKPRVLQVVAICSYSTYYISNDMLAGGSVQDWNVIMISLLEHNQICLREAFGDACIIESLLVIRWGCMQLLYDKLCSSSTTVSAKLPQDVERRKSCRPMADWAQKYWAVTFPSWLLLFRLLVLADIVELAF